MLRRVARVEPATDACCEENNPRSVRRLIVAANVVRISPILVALTSVLARATRHNTPEDGILHSHRRENLKFYKSFFCYHRTFKGFAHKTGTVRRRGGKMQTFS
jgi:hypothetical protein